jgi:hypothetical protein
VRRIVITSSCAAVVERSALPGVFNEDNWNDEAVRNTDEYGANASPLDKYCASKTVSEKGSTHSLCELW